MVGRRTVFQRRRTRVVAAALVAAGSLVVAGCGGGDEASGGADTGTAATATATAGQATTDASWNTAESKDVLKEICPETIVIQSDWFPTPERAVPYSLVGPDGTIDADRGRYSGPFGNTGVNVEVRAGGPYTGFAPFTATMYKDPEIFFGFMPTDEQVQNYAKQPTVSVVATLDINPQMLMYDPETYDFKSISDIGKSKAKVLYFEGLPFMDFLLHKGALREDQIDSSFDGSPARFITANGELVIQGYASNEPYRYEHDIRQWNRPVKYLLINDAGYEIYPENLAVRPDTIKKYPECLKKVVPMIQEAIVRYTKDPQPTNDTLIRISEAMDVPVPLTPGGNEFAVKTMLDEKIISNGPNQTVGDFDEERVQRVIDEQLAPVFEMRGTPIKKGLTADDIHTNEYIDPSIGLD